MMGAAVARFDPDVEASLLARYGMDPLDPSVTPRRLWNLLKHMPAGYAVEGRAAWSTESHLMASMVDAVNQLLFVTVKVNSKKGSRVPEVKPIPRPGDTVEKPATLRDLANLLSKERLVTES